MESIPVANEIIKSMSTGDKQRHASTRMAVTSNGKLYAYQLVETLYTGQHCSSVMTWEASALCEDPGQAQASTSTSRLPLLLRLRRSPTTWAHCILRAGIARHVARAIHIAMSVMRGVTCSVTWRVVAVLLRAIGRLRGVCRLRVVDRLLMPADLRRGRG